MKKFIPMVVDCLQETHGRIAHRAKKMVVYVSILVCAFVLCHGVTVRAACDASLLQPRNIQVMFIGNPLAPDVQITWDYDPAYLGCTNLDITSLLVALGLYSHSSPAPNGLDGEFGFTTFISAGCLYTVLWDGPYRNPATLAQAKESTCFFYLYGKETDPLHAGFEQSFGLEDIKNNVYGWGVNRLGLIIPSRFLCRGVSYEIRIWNVGVNVPPNSNITSVDIACTPGLYINESAPAVVSNAFTYPGALVPIAPPTITISGSTYANGTYTGTQNRVLVPCPPDLISGAFTVSAGCNYTESGAMYITSSPTYTFGAGVVVPGDIQRAVDSWDLFFANNLFSNGIPVDSIGVNPIVSYIINGNREICVYVWDPCNGSVGVTCIQFEVPTPDTLVGGFTYGVVGGDSCNTFVVQFIDSSTGGTVTRWNFGDGSQIVSTTDSVLLHTFTGPGPFTVTQSVVQTGACGDSIETPQTLVFTPVIVRDSIAVVHSSVISNTCDSMITTLSATVSDSSLSVRWSFGNGDSAIGLTVQAVYTVPDSYQVVSWTDARPCVIPDTFRTWVVFDPPFDTVQAGIAWQIVGGNGCDSMAIMLDNTSGNAVSYQWDIDTMSILTNADSSILYQFVSNQDTFIVVRLIAEGGACAVGDTVLDTIPFVQMWDTLVIQDSLFESYTVGCDSLVVIGFAQTTGGTIEWVVDGVFVPGDSIRLVYTTTGTHDITIRAVPQTDCVVGAMKSRQVAFIPQGFTATAGFTLAVIDSNGCDAWTIQFTDTHQGGTGMLVDYGNGTQGATLDTTIVYSSGSFTISQFIVDSRNCSLGDTFSRQIAFTPDSTFPIALGGFDTTINCDRILVTFTNESTGADRFTWIRDGVIVSTDSLLSPLTFTSSGNTAVQLIAHGTGNCSRDDTVSMVIAVDDPYGYTSAGFIFTPLLPLLGQDVSFTNQSQNADSYFWDFGDGSTSQDVDPVHAYSDTGTYIVCLDAVSAFRCPDSACKVITIVMNPDNYIEVPTAFTPDGNGDNDFFRVRYGNIERMRLRIWNRWGEKVFESTDPEIGWDGTYKGEPQEIDSYAWILDQVRFRDGSTAKRKQGNLQLVR